MANKKKVETTVTIKNDEIKRMATRYMALHARKKAIEDEMETLKQILVAAVDENGVDNKLFVVRSKDVVKMTAIPYLKEYVTFEELKKNYPKVAKQLRKTSSYVTLRVTKGKKGED